MYYTHFDFHRRPFPATPDETCYYPATSQESALLQMETAIRDGEGLVLMTGEAGAGKTLLCHCLLSRLPQDTNIAFLTSSQFENRFALLQAILYDFGLPHDGHSLQDLRLRLSDFLLENYTLGHKTLLIVDEAHQMTAELLSELHGLAGLESGQGRAIQLLLSAQMPLIYTLAQPSLTSLNQRLAVRTQLEALGTEEAIDYLLHHVRLAGGKPEDIFTEDALEIMAGGSRGLPRFLNQVAHHSLYLAYMHQLEYLDGEVAIEALEQLGLGEDTPDPDLQAQAAEVFSEQADLAEELSGIQAVSLPDTEDEELQKTEEQDVLSYRIYEPPKRPA